MPLWTPIWGQSSNGIQGPISAVGALIVEPDHTRWSEHLQVMGRPPDGARIKTPGLFADLDFKKA